MKQLAAMTALLSVFVLHSELSAQELQVNQQHEASEGAYTHDGFFLRTSMGFGGGDVLGEPDSGPGRQEITGSMGSLELSIGGAVRENLILHATMVASGLADPEFDTRGADFPDEGGDVTFGFIGVGATYYIMPANVYLSGSIGFNDLAFDDGDERLGNEAEGMAAIVQVGKEWWVSENLGLGVAGQFQAGGITDERNGRDFGWGYATYGVLFSATYN